MRGICVSLGILQLLLLLLGTTDGFKLNALNICEFNSTNLNDIEYIYSFFYNKKEFLRFSSSLGKYEGYTEFGVKQAEIANNNHAEIENRKLQKFSYCEHNIKIKYSNALSKSAPDMYAVLNASPSSGKERVLVCSIYDFYPTDITVTWMNNGRQIDIGVSNTEPMPNSDWYYQLHSNLEYTPRSGDKISCVIEHISLKNPLVLEYEGALSDGDRNKVAIGASGLVLGLVLSLAGFIYYRHKSRGLILVPTH